MAQVRAVTDWRCELEQRPLLFTMSTSRPEKRPLLGEQDHSGYGADHSINTKQDQGHVELSEGRQRTTGYEIFK